MDGIREYSASIPDSEIVDDALKLFGEIKDYESEVRPKMADDIIFANGNQWDATLRQNREFEQRPALTVPRILQFLNWIKNEQRQSKATIKIIAGDGKSKSEDARIRQAERRQGIIRQIQYESCAVDAYQCAFDYAVDCGRGFFRIRTDYENDNSFEQKILIDYIRNPLTVYPDRMRRLPDYSDMKHCFILQEISKDRFAKQYPDADPMHFQLGDHSSEWIQQDDLTIAEFYCIWTKKRELWELADGTVMYKDEIDKDFRDIQPVQKRTVLEPYLMWYKMTALEILEKKHLPGKWIPVIPVIGFEKDINGRLDIYGMTRFAKDIQRMYNFWVSSEAERLQLSTKAEYIIADGQIKGYEEYWKAANTKSFAYLPYKPQSINGSLVPPPSRQFPKQPDGAIIQAKMACVDDMKAVTGIYDPGLGNVSNEISGRAIMARQRQSDNANYHFIDGLRIALTHAGKIINSWLPVYYNGQRTVKIQDEEGNDRVVNLGTIENGEEITLGDGEFDVAVTMGPSYNTKRQESVEFMMDLVKSVPQVAPLIYDILVKNIDAPGALEISERLKKTIPPEVLDAQGGEDKLRVMLQQAMQQVQQDKQTIQVLSQQLQAAMQELEAKGIENKTKLQIAQINAQADIEVANIKALSDRNKENTRLTEFFYRNLQPSRKDA